jgi:hypothetical protein
MYKEKHLTKGDWIVIKGFDALLDDKVGMIDGELKDTKGFYKVKFKNKKLTISDKFLFPFYQE